MLHASTIRPARRASIWQQAAGLALLMVAVVVTEPLQARAGQKAQGEVDPGSGVPKDERQEASGRKAISNPVQLMAWPEISTIVDLDIQLLRKSPQVKPLLTQWPSDVIEYIEELLGAPLEKVQRVTIGLSDPSLSMPFGHYAGHVVTYTDAEAADAAGAPSAVAGVLFPASQPAEDASQSHARDRVSADPASSNVRLSPTMVLHSAPSHRQRFSDATLRDPPPAESLAGRLMQIAPPDDGMQRPVRMAFDVTVLLPVLQRAVHEARDQERPTLTHFEPLTADVDSVLFAATAEPVLEIDGRFDCRSPEAAERVTKALTAVRALAIEALDAEFGQHLDRKTKIMVSSLVSAGRRLVESLEFVPREASVAVQGHVNAPQWLALAAMVPPAVVDAQQTQARDNLKRIGLAFHLYHDKHGQFPPAVVEGPDGVKRSWRVELLPFLDAADLYARYRQDEPWDSESNLQVLKEIPPVFRHPRRWAASTDTGYLTVVGQGTALSGEKPQIRDFTDGLSNTILVMESNRGVPWTKPDDLPFEPEVILAGADARGKTVMLLGDGWVGELGGALTADMLRKMLTRAGGERIAPVDRP